jgi:hypothetical protein
MNNLEDFRKRLENRPQDLANQQHVLHAQQLAAQHQQEVALLNSQNQQLEISRSRWISDLVLLEEKISMLPGIYSRMEIISSTIRKGSIIKTCSEPPHDAKDYKAPTVSYMLPFRSRIARIIVQTGIQKKYSRGSSGGGMGGGNYFPPGEYEVPAYGLSDKYTLTDYLGVYLSSDHIDPKGVRINFLITGWNEIPSWDSDIKYKTLFSGPIYKEHRLDQPFNPNLGSTFEEGLENNFLKMYDEHLRLKELYKG